MALFSLFVFGVFLGIVVFFLSVMALIGIICLIAGLVKRKKYLRQGRKASYGLIKAGVFFLGVPVMLIRFFVLSAVSSTIKTHLLRIGNSNVVDKWKNERVISDRKASDEALEEIIFAADHNDRDAIIALYSENIQNDPELEKQVDAFLEEYNGKFSGLDFEYKGGGSQGSTNYGHVVDEFTHDYEVVLDEERYYIEIDACYQNTDHPEEVGITYFSMNSERGEVLYDDVEDHPRDRDKYYITARFDVPGDFETRRVGTIPWKYTPIDRSITKHQMFVACNNARDIDDVIEALGEPNAINTRLDEALYELEPISEYPLYAVVYYNNYGTVYAFSVSETGDGADYYEWFDVR